MLCGARAPLMPGAYAIPTHQAFSPLLASGKTAQTQFTHHARALINTYEFDILIFMVYKASRLDCKSMGVESKKISKY